LNIRFPRYTITENRIRSPYLEYPVYLESELSSENLTRYTMDLQTTARGLNPARQTESSDP